MATHPVKCILSQRRILARAFARYAWHHRRQEHLAATGDNALGSWADLPYETAERLIKEADDELEALLNGGSIAFFELQREVPDVQG